jgi:hypothetical protein
MSLADTICESPRTGLRRPDRETAASRSQADSVAGALWARLLGLPVPPSFEFEGYEIGVAGTQSQLQEVGSLIRRMYSWRGYLTSSDEGEAAAPAVSDRITLNALTGERVMGTLTVALDSPAGLAADGLYRDEIDALRAPGRRLCEFTRLAVDIEPRFNSKDFLARLIHIAFVYAHLIQHATDMVIEINPRHVGFYHRLLGFEQIGPERMCERVQAPAVLMHIDLRDMAKQIRLCGGGRSHGSARSLYPHFLDGVEQRVLQERMQHYLRRLKSPAMPLLPNFMSGFPGQHAPFAQECPSLQA